MDFFSQNTLVLKIKISTLQCVPHINSTLHKIRNSMARSFAWTFEMGHFQLVGLKLFATKKYRALIQYNCNGKLLKSIPNIHGPFWTSIPHG